MRTGALAYARKLFFWGRSGIAFPLSMFGPYSTITSVTRDGRNEIDVVVEDASTKSSVRYEGIVPSRGYLPTRVESRIADRLNSQVKIQDFLEPRPGVWAARTLMWTAWSDDNDVDGKPILTSRTAFIVTRLEFGDEAQIQDEEFSPKLPNDIKVVDSANANAAQEPIAIPLVSDAIALADAEKIIAGLCGGGVASQFSHREAVSSCCVKTLTQRHCFPDCVALHY